MNYKINNKHISLIAKPGIGVQKLNRPESNSNQQLNKIIQKSSVHFKYYSTLTLYDYNEYIQHTAKRLRADQNQTRNSRTGSLTSCSSNVQFRIRGIRTSSTNPHKRNIPNWNDRPVMGNCCKVGTEVEKVGIIILFFNIFLIYFYNYFFVIRSSLVKKQTAAHHT